MWITIAQFILSLSILIVLHELGHFTAAKWFKTRVEKFYLFFNPWFSIFKIKKGETEYGLGWLPLGGYVKISGMIDESMDKEQMKGPPQPWEFRSKPAWQRLIIMIGGVFVNFVLGILLFAIVFGVWGEKYLPNESITEGIAVDSLGYEIGLQEGDKPFDKFNAGTLNKALIIDGIDKMEIERNGRKQIINIDPKFSKFVSKQENNHLRFFHLRIPAVVKEIDEKSPAKPGAAGLRIGDEIVSVNGKSTPYYFQFENEVLKAKGDNTVLGVKRRNENVNITYQTMHPGRQKIIQKLLGKEAPKKRRIGFSPEGNDHFYNYATQDYGFGAALSKGCSESWVFLSDQVKAFGKMFTGAINPKDSLGSFITIGKLFGTEWDWQRFWRMTAMLSIILAFFNLLPIPALDGGYVMFLLFESITGMKVPDRVMEITTFIGFLILMTLMLFALGLDISRLF